MSWCRGTQQAVCGGDGPGPGKAGHGQLRLGKSCPRVTHVWTSSRRGDSSTALRRLIPSQAICEAICKTHFEGRWFGNYSAFTQTRKFEKYLFSQMENKRIWNLESKHLAFNSTSMSACMCPSGSVKWNDMACLIFFFSFFLFFF